MANIRMQKYLNGCCYCFKTKTINGHKAKHYFRVFDDGEIVIYTVLKLLDQDYNDGTMIRKFKDRFLHKEEIYIKQETFKTLMAVFEFNNKHNKPTNGSQLNDVFLPIRKTSSFSTNFTGQKNIV